MGKLPIKKQYLKIRSNNRESQLFIKPIETKRLTMKSFFTFPSDSQSSTSPSTNSTLPTTISAHFDLYKRIAHLNGAIVKCGITADECFSRFSQISNLSGKEIQQKLVAFQKFQPLFEEELNEVGTVTLKVKAQRQLSTIAPAILADTHFNQDVEFLPGIVTESVPEYLIANPELKISFLNIDLDDYECTQTALEFLYPRLMPEGILILENYYKGGSEYRAVNDYFYPVSVQINNFSAHNGPHYIMKP